MEEKACERDVEIGVLRCQVDQLVGEQKSIRERVRANERVVAIVSALGIGAGGIIGTAAFAPKANAMPITDTNGAAANEWVQKMKDWKLKQHWTPPVSTVNNAIEDLDSESEPKEELFVRDDDGMRIWNRIFRTK
ncbi:MAG: hypothetical protein AB8A39_01470 [Prochlorococcus sp.]